MNAEQLRAVLERAGALEWDVYLGVLGATVAAFDDLALFAMRESFVSGFVAGATHVMAGGNPVTPPPPP